MTTATRAELLWAWDGALLRWHARSEREPGCEWEVRVTRGTQCSAWLVRLPERATVRALREVGGAVAIGRAVQMMERCEREEAGC